MSDDRYDPDDYESVQRTWETSQETVLEYFEAREYDQSAPLPVGSEEEDLPRLLAVGDSTTFPLRYRQPCQACRVPIELGTRVAALKRLRGWSVWHPTCAPTA